MSSFKNKKWLFGIPITSTTILLLIIILLVMSVGSSTSNNDGEEVYQTGTVDEIQYNFIMRITENSYNHKNEYDILTSVTIAQAIEESGWGQSKLALNQKNYFGIKGDFNGASANGFRKYPTMKESVWDHDKLLSGELYNLNRVKDMNTILSTLDKVYCPNQGYYAKIENIINKYNLTIFDSLNENDLKLVSNNQFSYGDSITDVENLGVGNKKAVIETAKSLMGCRYWWGAKGEIKTSTDSQTRKKITGQMFDCSGYLWYCYQQNGYTEKRFTCATLLTSQFKSVSRDQIQPGDLVVVSGGSHVIMYLGNDNAINCGGVGSGDKCYGQNASACVQYTKLSDWKIVKIVRIN